MKLLFPNKHFILIVFFVLMSSILVCQPETFQTTIGGSADETYPRVIITNDNEYLVLNRTLSNSFGDIDIMLTKLDAVGQHIWTRNIGNTHRNYSKTIYETNDGFMVLGWQAEYGKIDDWLMVKLDSDASISEHKFFGSSGIDEELHTFHPIGDGNYIIGSTVREFNTNARVSFMDSNMNVYKTKTFMNDYGDQLMREGTYSNNHLTWCGSSSSKPLIVRVDANGDLDKMFYVNTPGSSHLRHIITLEDGSMIAVGYIDIANSGDDDILCIKLNSEGTVLWVKQMGRDKKDRAFDVKIKNDKTLLITGETESYGSSKDVFMINIDEDGNFISGHTYGTAGTENFGFFDINDDDVAIIVAETESLENTSTDILVIKTDQNGISCCYNTIEQIQVKNINASENFMSPYILTDFVSVSNHQFQFEKWHPSIQLVCAEPLNIIGPESACAYSEDIKYYVDPQDYYGFYDWGLPVGTEILNNDNDTAITVNFGNQSGYFYLRSKYCQPKNFDSLYVHLDEGLRPFLGNDTLICSNMPVTISPGEGYATYLWQDGSASSSYTTSEEGLFWVEVSNGEECKGRDSIYISRADELVIDIGPDTMMIPGEYIELDAGPGYDEYLWNEGSTSQKIRAYDPGQYWVTVYADNCMGSDTSWLYRSDCKISVPNIVTPNGDGIKDEIFVIPGQPVSHFEFTIYNFRGIEIFKTYDINFRWNGKQNGSILSSDLYIYTIKYLCPETNSTINEDGKILVIR